MDIVCAVRSERSVMAAEPQCGQSIRHLLVAKGLPYRRCPANPTWPES
jgi:hypothetical protein